MPAIQLKTKVKTILFTIFISISFSFYANDHTLTMSYFNHLSKINKEWLLHKELCPKGSISFKSDLDRIQLHLNLVVGYLKTNNPSNLNSEQLINRSFLLGKLQQYADNKVFPVNKYHLIRQPYFVDDSGTNCAVGQMIYLSGHEDLVAKISNEHNYDYIIDIHTEGIKEWANDFGFTVEELKWIQPSYQPSSNIEQVLDGTNGSVNKIVNNPFDGSLTIAGNFTELDSLPCLNIGYYDNNQLSCLGNGVDGIINDVLNQFDGIYAFGELHHNGQVYPIAKYDGTTWSYLGIPGRNSAISTAGNNGGIGHQFEVAISHSSFPQHQEIWHYLNNNTWEKKAKVKGVILDMLASSYGRVHTGHFDSVIVYNSSSTIDTSFIVNNVVINTNSTNHWFGIGNDISDTVNVVKEVGYALIFGGTCSFQTGVSNVCISRYYNSVLQPLFLKNYGTGNYSINSIAYGNGDEFVFGGDFVIIPFIGISGNNLAKYNLVHNRIDVITSLDQPVNSLSFLNGYVFLGGSFQTNLGVNSINFLGKTIRTVGINEPVSDITLNVFPNPFITTINLEGIDNGVNFSILNTNGQILKSGTVLNEKINDLGFLAKGTYLLKVESENGSIVTKISK